jgi:hypothetical protein
VSARPADELVVLFARCLDAAAECADALAAMQDHPGLRLPWRDRAAVLRREARGEVLAAAVLEVAGRLAPEEWTGMPSDLIHLDLVIGGATGKVVRVLNLKGERVWLPLSRIEAGGEPSREPLTVTIGTPAGGGARTDMTPDDTSAAPAGPGAEDAGEGFWPDPLRTPRHSDKAETEVDRLRGVMADAARQLAAWAPECFPANAEGQVHFARALMESVSETLFAAVEGREPDVNAHWPPPAGVPLARQIACARRELALRRIVYPRRERVGKMSPQEAKEELAAMEAVVGTLERLAEMQGNKR